MSTFDIEQVRVIARSLAKRAQSDRGFRLRIQADPAGVLTEAGLPLELVSTFLQETQLGEVTGYDMKQMCLISETNLIQDFIY